MGCSLQWGLGSLHSWAPILVNPVATWYQTDLQLAGKFGRNWPTGSKVVRRELMHKMIAEEIRLKILTSLDSNFVLSELSALNRCTLLSTGFSPPFQCFFSFPCTAVFLVGWRYEPISLSLPNSRNSAGFAEQREGSVLCISGRRGKG